MSLKIAELISPVDYMASVFVSKFKEKAFVTKTVNEILFQGWHFPIASEVEEYIGISVLPNNSFGLFVGVSGVFITYLLCTEMVKNDNLIYAGVV